TFITIKYALQKHHSLTSQTDTVAGKAIGSAPEQPLHVVALACPASRILKQLEYKILKIPEATVNLQRRALDKRNNVKRLFKGQNLPLIPASVHFKIYET
ncbi:MAG: hypothetical protein LBJ00_15850, partial [Planctomycetaceae bacterium]|nr:hypothetical protein [Planctomycetaceae bacterium]